MIDHLPFTIDTIEMFLLMFTRVVTIMAFLPIFGSSAIPPAMKVGLSLVLTGLIFAPTVGLHPLHIPGNFSGALLMVLIAKEVVVGLAIGFASTFLFAAVNFAARLVDTEMGFGMVELIDPFSEDMVTSQGQLWIIIFSIFMLLFNGHYFFLLAVQKSFDLIPVLGANFQAGNIASHFADMVGAVFVLAIKMSAPIYVTLIMTEMALGIVARTVPQINIYFVGLPMKIMIGLGATVIVLPTLAGLFKKIFEGLLQDIWAVLYMMA
jgi:flagellar biosynthesis protein FliR